MKKLLVILFLILVSSCSTESSWSAFKAEGLPSDSETYSDMVFVNDSLGYLGGSRLAMSGTIKSHSLQHQAVLYRTTDKGKSWQQIPVDYQGGVGKVFELKDTLVLLLQHVTSDTNYILKYPKLGKEVERILSYPRSHLVRGMHFESPSSGKIILDDRKEQNLLTYNGSKWDTLLTLPKNHYRHMIYEDKVVSLVPESGTGHTKGILVTDIQTQQKKELLFAEPYAVASLTKAGDELYLAASKDGKGKIIKYSGGRVDEIGLGEYAEYKPDEVFVFGSTIAAVGNRQKDIAFLGVSHSFLFSKDDGKTWVLEELPNPLSFSPAFLYRDQFFISIEFNGHFQIRQ